MEDPSAKRPFEKQKNAPVPSMGQKRLLLRYHPNWRLSTPTRFTRHHACPVDNGWGPVGIYWGEFPVQAALGSPFTPRFRSRFHCPGLALPRRQGLLLSLIGFVVVHYMRPAGGCQEVPQILAEGQRSRQRQCRGRDRQGIQLGVRIPVRSTGVASLHSRSRS